MPKSSRKEPLLDLYIFETRQMLEELEQKMLQFEQTSELESSIHEIFRIMHTIKSSSALMKIKNIANLAHSSEDLFSFLREVNPRDFDGSGLADLVLNIVDFMKTEIIKIDNQQKPDGDCNELIRQIEKSLAGLQQSNPEFTARKKKAADSIKYDFFFTEPGKAAASPKKNRFRAVVFFEKDCQMENTRAFGTLLELKEVAEIVHYYPDDIIDNKENELLIRNSGFHITFRSDLSFKKIKKFFGHIPLIEKLQLQQLKKEEPDQAFPGVNFAYHPGEPEQAATIESLEPRVHPEPGKDQLIPVEAGKKNVTASSRQIIINVNVAKLDLLLDLIGELVIAEALVTHNSDLDGLSLDNFDKAARQLRKITNEIQDVVMSIRMLPLTIIFRKMNRLVRDMGHTLGKEIRLETRGEETEVDKNIIEHISDPLIHLIRNAIDHGIEPVSERIAKGKPEYGTISLEAKEAGGDVRITVKDDGAGLDKQKILQLAKQQRLLTKPEHELTDREIFSFILLPGFSTKETVTEYSGRGVGMDVVKDNIEKIRGNIFIDSVPNEGTAITIRVPLTLAIITGMTISVGYSRYTVPIDAIVESLKVSGDDVITGQNGKEAVVIRGKQYPLIRLHRLYNVKTEITEINDGIVMMVQNESKRSCLFADGILGEQQVVIKPLPIYIDNIKGIGGCALLGDGAISLVLDIEELLSK